MRCLLIGVMLALTLGLACSDDSPARMPQFDFSVDKGASDATGESVHPDAGVDGG